MNKRFLTTICILTAVFLAAAPAIAVPSAGFVQFSVPLLDGPLGDPHPVRQAARQPARPATSRLLALGKSKGITNVLLESEAFAAPDIAVLSRGHDGPWPDLLNEINEPSILVGSADLAGISTTKSLLIIPTGGLAGFAGSTFAKAGLAAYAASGGVIVVMTQQNSGDYSSLPIEKGAIKASGWTDEKRTVFRSSSVRDRHPLVSTQTSTVLDLATAGCLHSLPEGSRAVLSRSDGCTTLAVYPYGQGQVIVTSLFLDLAFDSGLISRNEMDLLRGIVSWSRARSRGIVDNPSLRSSSTASAAVTPAPGPQVAFDQPAYTPGQKVTAVFSGFGKGELSVTAPGYFGNQMMTDTGNLGFTLPTGLPGGSYQVAWRFITVDNTMSRGDSFINVIGPRAVITRMSVSNMPGQAVDRKTARLRIEATAPLKASARLQLHRPDGTVVDVGHKELSLLTGTQEAAIDISFATAPTGIMELFASIEAVFPAGPGLVREPVPLAQSAVLLDSGRAMVLGLDTARPVYYDTAGPVEVIIHEIGSGRAQFDLSLDGQTVESGTITLSGPGRRTLPLPLVTTGMHTLRARLSSAGLDHVRERTFGFGVDSPDLEASLSLPEIDGLHLPTVVTITNIGRTPSPQTRALLSEQGIDGRSRPINGADIPPLEPGKAHSAVIDWPLAGKAGARMLAATADAENVIAELDEKNNTGSASVAVPPVMLIRSVPGSTFSTDDALVVDLSAASLSDRNYRGLSVALDLVSRAGRTVLTDRGELPDLAPGVLSTVRRKLDLASLPSGTYTLKARTIGEAAAFARTASVAVQPTMSFRGSLEGTPSAAGLCLPLTIHAALRDTGNIPATGGAATLELLDTATTYPALVKQLPLSPGATSITIENVSFPRGRYEAVLKATLRNNERGILRNITLDKRPLTIEFPVRASWDDASVPRVLIFFGRSGTRVRQVVGEQIVAQAFADGRVHYRIADTAEDFAVQAESGVFTTYVLFEPDDPVGRTDWLTRHVAGGASLVIIGSDDQARLSMESFGFEFGAPPPQSGDALSFGSGPGAGLAGTLPVSGQSLVPRRKTARVVAEYAGIRQPAALVEERGEGRVLVLPVSLTRSAQDSGATSLYGLLFRAMVTSAAPLKEQDSGLFARELTITSPGGPVRARISTAFPQHAELLWSNQSGTLHERTLDTEITASAEPLRILYLFRSPSGKDRNAVAEIFFECSKGMVSQGKVK